MENLNKKQKIVIFFIATIMILIIVYYIVQKTKKYESINIEEIIEESAEENILNDNKEKIIETIIIHIAGSVHKEGVIELKSGARISEAIEKAGGLKGNADISNVNLAYIVQDGQKIYIPSIDDKKEGIEVILDNNDSVIINYEENKKNMININTATQTELETLEGIGPSTALKIIEYRNTNGRFKRIDEIKNVPGIGESKYQYMKNNICI